MRRTVWSTAAAIGALLCFAPGAPAFVEIHVTTTVDEFGSGPDCSLREAVETANNAAPFGGCTRVVESAIGSNSILLVPGRVYELTRGGKDDTNVGGDLDFTEPAGIHSRRPPDTPDFYTDAATIRALHGDRIAEYHPFAPCSFAPAQCYGSGFAFVNLTGGQSNLGGAIRVRNGSDGVQLQHTTIHGNAANDGPSAAGGAIAVDNGAVLSMGANNTISGNTANGAGGGIYLEGSMVGAVSTTTSDNTARADGEGPQGGGGIALGPGGSFSAPVRATILAGNRDSGPSPAPECAGTIPSAGSNLVGNPAGCAFGPGPGDVIGVADPGLGPLRNNGNFYLTHGLARSSPAVDAAGPIGPDGCPGNTRFDQRFMTRTAQCDIGAIELVTCADVPVNTVGEGGTTSGTSGPDGILDEEDTPNELLRGLGGNDGICAHFDDRGSGGPGADTFMGRGSATFIGGPGNDRLIGAANTQVGFGGPGKDLFTGGNQSDQLSGGSNEDRLFGGPQDDRLSGGDGNDRLNGGPGFDRCDGGAGADAFTGCEVRVP